jgi:hypothetical protein
MTLHWLCWILRPKQVCAGLKALKIATSQRHSKNAGLGWSRRSRPPKCGFWSQGLLETPEATGGQSGPVSHTLTDPIATVWIHCTEDASMPSNDWDKQNPTALGSIGRLPATKWFSTLEASGSRKLHSLTFEPRSEWLVHLDRGLQYCDLQSSAGWVHSFRVLGYWKHWPYLLYRTHMQQAFECFVETKLGLQ